MMHKKKQTNKLIVGKGVNFLAPIFNCNFQFRLSILNSKLNFNSELHLKFFISIFNYDFQLQL